MANLSIVGFQPPYFYIQNNTNRALTYYARVNTTSGSTPIWSDTNTIAPGDEVGPLTISGLSNNTDYTLRISSVGMYANVDDLRTFTTGDSSGGSTPTPSSSSRNLDEQITYKNWSASSTLWADENHGSNGISSEYGYSYTSNPSYRYLDGGFSFQLGWLPPSYDVDYGYLYAATTSGAYCTSYTENSDNTVTYVITSRVRSRLYQNFPHFGLLVTYTDENDNWQNYIEYKPANGSQLYVNRISGTNNDKYFRTVEESWANQQISLTWERGDSATTKHVRIQVYHDINETIYANDAGNYGNFPHNLFKNTLDISLPIPQRAGYSVEVEDDGNGTASITYNGNTETSFVVPNNSSVSFNATPNTDYVFEGWYDNTTDNFVSSDNPYTVTITSDLVLVAKFEEDASDKAMYLNEIMTTNKSYRLVDGSAAHGSGTSGRLVKWDTAKTMGDAPVITGSTSAPSSLINGYITAYNSEDYPNETSFTWGNEAIYESSGQTGDKIRAGLKVVFQSETATTYTVRVYCMLSQNASTYLNSSQNLTWRYYENNVNMTPYSGNPNLPSDTSVYTNYTSDTNFGAWFKGLNSWQELVDYPNQWNCPKPVSDATGGNNTTCNYYKDIVIQKTNRVQDFVVKNTVKYYPRSDSLANTWSEVEKTIVVPPIGYTTAVGYNGSVKKGRTYVKYNGSWHDAIMWVNVNGTWVKAHYY